MSQESTQQPGESRLRRAVGVVSHRFAVGLLILIPVVLTVVILQFAFEFLDGLLGPVLSTALGREIPGVGLVALVLIMLLTGVLALSGAARSVSRWMERIVSAIPFVGTIYGIGKKMTGSSSDGAGFNRVVLVEYPRDGVWSMGFLTGFTQVDGQLHAFVYLPTAPMPNSGWIALIEAARVYDTDLSTQDAMQAVLSSGISNPDSIRRRPLRELQEAPSNA